MSKSHLMMKNVKYCGVRFLRQRNSSFVEGKIIWVTVSYVRKLPSLISNSIRADLYGPKSPFQKKRDFWIKMRVVEKKSIADLILSFL